MHLKKIMTTVSLLIASISPAKATDIYICQNCPTGYWSNGYFKECKSCLTTGVSACSSTTGKATSCKAGYGFNSSAGTCTQCSAGYYSAGGTASCSKCLAGSYCPNKGMSAPINCPSGQYQPNTGATSCNTCSNGSETCEYDGSCSSTCDSTCSTSCNCSSSCNGNSACLEACSRSCPNGTKTYPCKKPCSVSCKKSGTRTVYKKVSSDRKSCVLDYKGTCS